MKKVYLLLLSVVLAMVSATSCMQEQTSDYVEETIESVADVPVEVDGFGSSRGVIKESGNAIEVWWSSKSAIGVYGSSQKNVKYTSTNSYKNAQTTTFSGGSLFSSPKYAYYPYSSSNSGASQTAVGGELPMQQSYSTSSNIITTDYKIGKYASRTLTSTKFNFSHVMTFVKFAVNATGTELEGEKIQSITMTVKSSDNSVRQLWGKFTMDLTKSASNALTWDAADEDANTLILKWGDTPRLKSGQTYAAYMSAAPVVEAGDEIEFEILTENYSATFTRTSEVDYSANLLVNYSMPLADMSDVVIENLNGDDEGNDEGDDEVDQPVSADLKINSFKFTVANNPGKILPRKFSHNSSFALTTSTIDEVVCEVDNEARTIKAYIPYLNDRKLVPTFDIPEGLTLGLKDVYESGVTEVDFLADNRIALGNLETLEYVFYTVELTNTGLPVVVINQNTDVTSTEKNSKYTKASNAWYKATNTKWVPKDADWPDMNENDNFIVYNADGTIAVTNKSGETVSAPIASATRIRGNVTQQMPKKSFAVKLDKKSGVLDMPAHKRWVLLANWKDRTLMRNAVANGIAKVFRDNLSGGMPWNPSGRYVELVYNGVHVGTYYLCEQIKIDENRLDINEPYDAEENAVAPEYCGILLESDDGYDEAYQFTTANYVPFLFKDDATDAMVTYASNFVRGIEDKLYAGNYDEAFKSMDLTSFVDFWLIQELMMNSETAHPKSCYSYINDGVMYAGPLWDFDWNTLTTSSDYSENSYSYTESMLKHAVPTSGWFGSKTYKCYHKKSGYPVEPLNESDANYIWYPMLVKSDAFKNMAAERWNEVKDAVLAYVNNEIPKIQAEIAASEALNNKMWPVDSSSRRYSTYGIGGGYCGDEGKDLSGAVSAMQSTLKTRINGMNGYVIKKDWPSVSYGSK